jgi:hypothetical protein
MVSTAARLSQSHSGTKCAEMPVCPWPGMNVSVGAAAAGAAEWTLVRFPDAAPSTHPHAARSEDTASAARERTVIL